MKIEIRKELKANFLECMNNLCFVKQSLRIIKNFSDKNYKKMHNKKRLECKQVEILNSRG